MLINLEMKPQSVPPQKKKKKNPNNLTTLGWSTLLYGKNIISQQEDFSIFILAPCYFLFILPNYGHLRAADKINVGIFFFFAVPKWC